MKKYTTISDFMSDLTPELRAQVSELRRIIVAAEPSLTEHIKWNAPSFMYKGEDRITLNASTGELKLLIHMGATKKEDKDAPPVLHDTSGIVEWKSNIRGLIVFTSLEDIKNKHVQLTTILQSWLAL